MVLQTLLNFLLLLCDIQVIDLRWFSQLWRVGYLWYSARSRTLINDYFMLLNIVWTLIIDLEPFSNLSSIFVEVGWLRLARSIVTVLRWILMISRTWNHLYFTSSLQVFLSAINTLASIQALMELQHFLQFVRSFVHLLYLRLVQRIYSFIAHLYLYTVAHMLHFWFRRIAEWNMVGREDSSMLIDLVIELLHWILLMDLTFIFINRRSLQPRIFVVLQYWMI